ncbi:MAG TPA: N-acetylmuramoyl-L-alanine amidase [Patescibacteria group bacterium]|nr:N-acetylmuramoyl-L-alanine amidase [Patescibacteria group bacterium]
MYSIRRSRRTPGLAAAIVTAIAFTIGGSSAPSTTAAAGLPLSGVVIAVDPGHNGGNAAHLDAIRRLVWIGNGWKACNTVGTSTRTGYPEHRFTFAVALRVKARLEGLGATVYLTRPSDQGYGPCVDARGKFGAAVHAQLTVSIHGDGAPSSNRGFFIMKPGVVAGYTDDIRARSAVLAASVRSGLVSAGLPIANYYATNGIVSRTDLGTLNMSDVPAIMVELGNMKNSTDAARMMSLSGRDRYAVGLVSGIRRFLGR